MVEHIEAVKSRYAVAAAALAATAGFSASSYKRWKRRICCGCDPVQKPGPKKVAPIDLEKLEQRLIDLRHDTSKNPF